MECKEETESFCGSPLAQRPRVDKSESFFLKRNFDSVFGCCFPFSIPCFVLIYPQPNPLDLGPAGKQLSLRKLGTAQLLFHKQCHDITSDILFFMSNAYQTGNYY